MCGLLCLSFADNRVSHSQDTGRRNVQCEYCGGAVDSNGTAVDANAANTSAWCSLQGTCGADNLCSCSPGYWGDGCEKECPGGADSACNGRGDCNADGTCSCHGGYGGDSCEVAPGVVAATIQLGMDILDVGGSSNHTEWIASFKAELVKKTRNPPSGSLVSFVAD